MVATSLQAYHQRHAMLASFASDVVALDEMHLDQVKRRLPLLRHFQQGRSGTVARQAGGAI